MPICFVVHLFITIVNDGLKKNKIKKNKKTPKLSAGCATHRATF